MKNKNTNLYKPQIHTLIHSSNDEKKADMPYETNINTISNKSNNGPNPFTSVEEVLSVGAKMVWISKTADTMSEAVSEFSEIGNLFGEQYGEDVAYHCAMLHNFAHYAANEVQSDKGGIQKVDAFAYALNEIVWNFGYALDEANFDTVEEWLKIGKDGLIDFDNFYSNCSEHKEITEEFLKIGSRKFLS